MLKEIELAPNFSLEDQFGKIHSLADYKGRYVLLYFYPKDDTPGCTKEACAIRDLYKDFELNNVKVLGVNTDSVESHRKFANKYDLPFTLLSDPKKEAIKLYDAGFIFVKRISYLIGPDGKIAKVYPKVSPTEHGAEILKDIYSLKN
jgi:peroxiredoxin Q/BCP